MRHRYIEIEDKIEHANVEETESTVMTENTKMNHQIEKKWGQKQNNRDSAILTGIIKEEIEIVYKKDDIEESDVFDSGVNMLIKK